MCSTVATGRARFPPPPFYPSARQGERQGETQGGERVEEHKETERWEENFPVQSVGRVLACMSVGRGKLAVRKLPEVLRQVQKSAEVIGGRSLGASISHSIAGGKCSLLRRSKVLSPPPLLSRLGGGGRWKRERGSKKANVISWERGGGGASGY